MKSDLIDALKGAIGADAVLTGEPARRERRFDYWSLSHLRDWRGDDLALPGCVVRPCSVAAVQAVIGLAAAHRVPVIPWGLGSGVCGGVVADPSSIILDMGAMNTVRGIDTVDLLGSFDAGINGMVAEEAVAREGLTIGHWPQSIAVSSLGGWISTRASGQFSTAYGNIEDIVHSIEAVLPDGSLVVLGKAPRAAAGPDLRHVLLGAEGTMGVVTGVTLSLRRQAAARGFSAFLAPDMATGFEAQRRIVQADWWPPVMRQYDGREVARMFPDHARGDSPLVLLVHEGPAVRVEAERAAVAELAAGAGLESINPEVCREWMERRNHVPSWRDFFAGGVVLDTIEVSGSWTRVDAIYRDAVASLNAMDGMVNASAHSSHVYRPGINLYFTFAVRPADTAGMEPAYLEAWSRVMEAVARHGGGIAHHHGAGRVRRDHLHHDLGANGLALLRRLKAAVDPLGIMNPGVLLPDA